MTTKNKAKCNHLADGASLTITTDAELDEDGDVAYDDRTITYKKDPTGFLQDGTPMPRFFVKDLTDNSLHRLEYGSDCVVYVTIGKTTYCLEAPGSRGREYICSRWDVGDPEDTAFDAVWDYYDYERHKGTLTCSGGSPYVGTVKQGLYFLWANFLEWINTQKKKAKEAKTNVNQTQGAN